MPLMGRRGERGEVHANASWLFPAMAVACFALSLSTYTWARPVPGWGVGGETRRPHHGDAAPPIRLTGPAGGGDDELANAKPPSLRTMHTARIIIFWLALASSDSPTHADLDASYDVLAKPRATSLGAQ